MPIYKNVARQVVAHQLKLDGSDNTTTLPTVTVSKDGGAFAAASDTPTHIAGGVHELTLTASEMNADVVAVKFVAASCVTVVEKFYPEADYTAVRAGYINASLTAMQAEINAIKASIDASQTTGSVVGDDATTTVFAVTGLDQADNYVGMQVQFTSGANNKTRKPIVAQANDGADVRLTVESPFGAAPAEDDTLSVF